MPEDRSSDAYLHRSAAYGFVDADRTPIVEGSDS
jgi:hypothetical protein